MEFLEERTRLLTGNANDSGSVIVQAFAWPPPGGRGGLPALLILGLIRWSRRGRPDTVAVYPLGSSNGAYPFGIVPLEVLAGTALPAEACIADWYGNLEGGHAVAFQIAGELYFPTGPFVQAPMWAPRLRMGRRAASLSNRLRSRRF